MSIAVLSAVVIYLLLMLAHYGSEPARWWCLFGQRTEVSYREWFGVAGLVAMISYLVPAKLGMPARLLILNRRYGIPLVTVTLTLSWDMVIALGVWGGFAVMAAAGLARRGVTFELPQELHWILIIGGLLLVLGVWAALKLKHFKGWQSRPGVPPLRLAGVGAIVALDAFAEGLRHIALVQILRVPVDWQVAFLGGIAAGAAGLISLMPMGLGTYDLTLIAILVAGGGDWQSAAMVCAVHRAALLMYALIIGLWGSRRIGLGPRELIRQARSQVSQLAARRKRRGQAG